MATRTVLLIDDDGHIREVVRFALDQAGYRVLMAADGLGGLKVFQDTSVDLLVLDLLMPGMDGFEVCQRVRRQSRVPILFLSSKDEELDRILGLELGADDYITKPFSPRELVARVKAALRRYDEILEAEARPRPAPRADDAILWGVLRLDPGRHKLWVKDQEILLTASEFSLLRSLMESSGRVLTRNQLVESAFGPTHFVSDRTVDSHIRRIRQKLSALGADPIETVYGVGYQLREPM